MNYTNIWRFVQFPGIFGRLTPANTVFGPLRPKRGPSPLSVAEILAGELREPVVVEVGKLAVV